MSYMYQLMGDQLFGISALNADRNAITQRKSFGARCETDGFCRQTQSFILREWNFRYKQDANPIR